MGAISIPPRFEEYLLEQAASVRLVFFAIDGVWTDGSLYFDAQGETVKRFHVLDGLAVKLLKRAGIYSVVITERNCPAFKECLSSLGVRHIAHGCLEKQRAAREILQNLGISWAQVAAMGDDWPDIAIMQNSVIAAAPPTAHIEVLRSAHYITQAKAGAGAVREFADLLLMATGYYGQFLQEATLT